MYKSAMSSDKKDLILNKLAEISSELNPQAGMNKKASTLSTVDKERIVNSLLADPTGRGFRRVAYAMTEPLRKRLDYLGIGRKLLEVDLLPQGGLRSAKIRLYAGNSSKDRRPNYGTSFCTRRQSAGKIGLRRTMVSRNYR